MTTVTSPNLVWGPAAGPILDTRYPITGDLNDADNSMALCFAVPKTGNMNKVGIEATAVTGNPPPYNISLVTVDTSGDPGTVTYGGASIGTVDFTGAGWNWITLATPAAGTAGDIVAARVWPNLAAGTPDGSNYARVRLCYPGQDMGPTVAKYYTARWNDSDGLGMGVMYDDNSIAAPAVMGYQYDIDTGTTPDEVGAKFTVPFACTCSGATVMRGASLPSSDHIIRLYDNAGGTVATTGTVDISEENQDEAMYAVYRWASVNLAADTTYRLTLAPTTAGNVQVIVATVNEVESRYWFTEGTRWLCTERTDAGAWTDTTTKIPMMGLILDSFELPEAGTAAGTVTGWAGGMMIG